MKSLRIARVAARLRPSPSRLPLQRRTYADAVSDKIKLTLALPHQVRDDRYLLSLYVYTILTYLQSIYKSTDVYVVPPNAVDVDRRRRDHG